MYNSSKRKVIKISNFHDLRVAKEGFRYEVKLREQALKLGVSQFKDNLRESAKKSAQHFTQKIVTVALTEFLKRRIRKQSSAS